MSLRFRKVYIIKLISFDFVRAVWWPLSCVDVYVIAIAFTIGTLSQPVSNSELYKPSCSALQSHQIGRIGLTTNYFQKILACAFRNKTPK